MLDLPARLFWGRPAYPIPLAPENNWIPGGDWYRVDGLPVRFGLFARDRYRVEIWSRPDLTREVILYKRDGTEPCGFELERRVVGAGESLQTALQDVDSVLMTDLIPALADHMHAGRE